MITLQEKDEVMAEVKQHFDHLWPLIVAGREDPATLDLADSYLGQVKAVSEIQYRVTIRMIEVACGLSWDAIVGDDPSRAWRVAGA